jgi:hypothetical protein
MIQPHGKPEEAISIYSGTKSMKVKQPVMQAPFSPTSMQRKGLTAQKHEEITRLRSAGTSRFMKPIKDLNKLAYGSYANMGAQATNPLQAL